MMGCIGEGLTLRWSSSIADGRGRWIDDARCVTGFCGNWVRSFSVGRPHVGADGSEWPHDRAFGLALSAVQDRVSDYAMGFAKVARRPDPAARVMLGRVHSETLGTAAFSGRTAATVPSPGDT